MVAVPSEIPSMMPSSTLTIASSDEAQRYSADDFDEEGVNITVSPTEMVVSPDNSIVGGVSSQPIENSIKITLKKKMTIFLIIFFPSYY
jgi:hypothetical protein